MSDLLTKFYVVGLIRVTAMHDESCIFILLDNKTKSLLTILTIILNKAKA